MIPTNRIYNHFIKISNLQNVVNQEVDCKRLQFLIQRNLGNISTLYNVFQEIHDYIKICYELNEFDPKYVNQTIRNKNMWGFFLNIGATNLYIGEGSGIESKGLKPTIYKIVIHYFNFNKTSSFTLVSSTSLKK